MSNGVLLLNASYEPLQVVSLRRAIVLLLKEKAEIVEADGAELHSGSLVLPKPSVIRLVYYVKIPSRLHLPLTRKMVLARDNYTCQYCGRQFPKSELTIDHVIPKSRGGETTWDNVVVACRRCNQRKGNRTPKEAGMKLLREPYEPRYVAIVILGEGSRQSTWEKYLGMYRGKKRIK